MRKLMATLLLAAMAGCGAVGKQIVIDTGKCAAGQVPDAVAAVLPSVEQALLGTPVEWSNEQTQLELTYGIDFAICAIEAAIHDLTAKRGALLPDAVIAYDRAQVALAELKAKKAGR
jgi:hypothetical protein